MSVQRWGHETFGAMVKSDNGVWVTYADHLAALADVYTLMGEAVASGIEQATVDEKARIRTGVTGMRPETDPDIAHVIVSDVLAVIDPPA